MAFFSATKPLLNKLLKKKALGEARFALPQDRETAVYQLGNKKMTCRCGYARAQESKQLGDKGQDYLSLYFGNDKVVFAVCDGVSQSFFGDIAARYLGDLLVEWFTGIPEGATPEFMQWAMGKGLQEATAPAGGLVDAHILPPDIPPMLKSVLEDKRKLGSETTFVAGRIDLPGTVYPEGRVIVTWLGDSRLRIWDENREMSDRLNGEFATMQRWSTRRGAVGSNAHVFMSPVAGRMGVKRILVYTDGLSTIDHITGVLSSRQLQANIDATAEVPTSDDIAVIEVLLEPWNARLINIDASDQARPHDNNKTEDLSQRGTRKGV